MCVCVCVWVHLYRTGRSLSVIITTAPLWSKITRSLCPVCSVWTHLSCIHKHTGKHTSTNTKTYTHTHSGTDARAMCLHTHSCTGMHSQICANMCNHTRMDAHMRKSKPGFWGSILRLWSLAQMWQAFSKITSKSTKETIYLRKSSCDSRSKSFHGYFSESSLLLSIPLSVSLSLFSPSVTLTLSIYLSL